MPWEPYACTTSGLLMTAVATDAMGSLSFVHDPIAQAQEYIKEHTQHFLFEMVSCGYCRSTYPANLETGYECPGCGAYDYKVERRVDEWDYKDTTRVLSAR